MNEMKLARNLGVLLLAIWFIRYGLIALFSMSFQGHGLIMGLLVIAAGIFIFLGR
jgi:hypothetical protein